MPPCDERRYSSAERITLMDDGGDVVAFCTIYYLEINATIYAVRSSM